MKKVLLIGGSDGIGGLIQTFQCAYYVKQAGIIPEIKISARDEVYKPLEFLFKNDFLIKQWPEEYSQEHRIIFDNNLFHQMTDGYDEIYYNCPDLLYRNRFAFNYKKYNTHPQSIRTTRLLTGYWKPEKIIFCALTTSTDAYKFNNIRNLLLELANRLPDYQIYINQISKWANIDINNENLDGLPNNCIVFEDQDFIESLKWLMKSEYCICLDNGISHIAYNLSIPRLLLDKRLNFQGIPWMARWRSDFSESIGYDHPVENIARLVETNLRIPQSCLIPRNLAVGCLFDINWSELLIFKV